MAKIIDGTSGQNNMVYEGPPFGRRWLVAHAVVSPKPVFMSHEQVGLAE